MCFIALVRVEEIDRTLFGGPFITSAFPEEEEGYDKGGENGDTSDNTSSDSTNVRANPSSDNAFALEKERTHPLLLRFPPPVEAPLAFVG